MPRISNATSGRVGRDTGGYGSIAWMAAKVAIARPPQATGATGSKAFLG